MNQNLTLPCILGEGIVSQLLSAFNGSIVNDAKAENDLIVEMNEKIKSTCDTHLSGLVQRFFSTDDAESTALAFDVNPDHLTALKEGIELKADHLLTSTRKIVVLVALMTHTTFEALDDMVHDVIAMDSKYKKPYPKNAIAA